MRARTRVRALALAVVATLVGATATLGAAASASPSSGTVVLRTSPAMAGVHLVVGGTAVTTGADGSARVSVADLNGVKDTVRLSSSAVDPRRSVAIAFVSSAPHTAAHESRLTVGLDVSAKVALRISSGTTGVPASSVSRVRLHSLTGQIVQLDPRRTTVVTLLARKARLVGGVPTPQVVTWSVDGLRAGAGVSLTTAKARFDPLSASTWTLVLRPVTGTVLIDTVPRVAGVSVLVDGASFTTDANGRAHAVVGDLNGVAARVSLASTLAPGAQVQLLRVGRGVNRVARQRHLILALEVSRPVTLTFTDPRGTTIPPERVSEVVLTSGLQSVSMTGAAAAEGVMVAAQTTRQIGGAWKVLPVSYSVKSVVVDGGDAVFAGQQRFSHARSTVWDLTLSVYDVSLTARDVLFGTRIESVVDVMRPDGSSEPVTISSDGVTTLPALVRGEYVLTNRSAALGAASTIRVSRSSQVDMRVVTKADVLVLGALGAALCVGLVLAGQAWARRARRGGGAP
ncbi:MAG TPA: hypothetical protein VFL59_03335 [Candidatus Nanopelagicales bacterium]|nr:hypothetical protein [Candidatus Nanopelagicales bacterium]